MLGQSCPIFSHLKERRLGVGLAHLSGTNQVVLCHAPAFCRVFGLWHDATVSWSSHTNERPFMLFPCACWTKKSCRRVRFHTGCRNNFELPACAARQRRSLDPQSSLIGTLAS